MSKKHRRKTERNDIDDFEDVDDIEYTNYGMVVDCSKLNVRKTPDMDGLIVGVVAQFSEVVVDYDESTEEFYKVCLATGLEGYCLKKFIKTGI